MVSVHNALKRDGVGVQRAARINFVHTLYSLIKQILKWPIECISEYKVFFWTLSRLAALVTHNQRGQQRFTDLSLDGCVQIPPPESFTQEDCLKMSEDVSQLKTELTSSFNHDKR
jgi:hypothetical protein